MSGLYHFFRNSTTNPFSNWFPCHYVYDEEVFNSVEQGFQYSKAKYFKDEDSMALIKKVPSARLAQQLGRNVKDFNERDWHLVRARLMFEHNRQKFLQNPELRASLIGLGHQLMVNHSTRDKYWGIGTSKPGTRLHQITKWGENSLGKELTYLKGMLIQIALDSHLKSRVNNLASNVRSTRKPQQHFSPERCSWEKFVGSKYQQIFHRLDVNPNGVVVEVGPGSVSKVGEGLKQFNFKGKIYIVEPEPVSLAQIATHYHQLMPDATVIAVSMTLDKFLQSSDLPEIDLAVSNHVLDDMIIGKFISSNTEFKDFFEDHYEEPDIGVTAKLWEDLARDVPSKIKIIAEVVSECLQLSALSKSTVISAYDSYVFRTSEDLHPPIQHAHTFSQNALKKIRVGLEEMEFDVLDLSKEQVIQDPEFWIAAHKKT